MESALSVRLSLQSSSIHGHQLNPFGNSANLILINQKASFSISKPLKTSGSKISATSQHATTSAASTTVSKTSNSSIIHKLKLAARAIVFAATVAAVSKFQQYPARAEPATQSVVTSEAEKQEETESPEVASKFQQYPAGAEPATQSIVTTEAEKQGETQSQEVVVSTEAEKQEENQSQEVADSNSEFIDAMKIELIEKLEAGEDEECLKILKKLVSAQPEIFEWKFLLASLFHEMGHTQSARDTFEEVLAQNPLCFEALFENAMLMDSCGEGEAVTKRLEQALEIAEEEKKVKEARDVRLIIAQVQFLQKKVDEALKSYDELTKEDPNDFRPYFCKGMIFSFMDKMSEANEQFAKYRELSRDKSLIDGYLEMWSSLRKKFFGTSEQN